MATTIKVKRDGDDCNVRLKGTKQEIVVSTIALLTSLADLFEADGLSKEQADDAVNDFFKMYKEVRNNE